MLKENNSELIEHLCKNADYVLVTPPSNMQSPFLVPVENFETAMRAVSENMGLGAHFAFITTVDKTYLKRARRLAESFRTMLPMPPKIEKFSIEFQTETHNFKLEGGFISEIDSPQMLNGELGFVRTEFDFIEFYEKKVSRTVEV